MGIERERTRRRKDGQGIRCDGFLYFHFGCTGMAKLNFNRFLCHFTNR
jgi:hypothetical protein